MPTIPRWAKIGSNCWREGNNLGFEKWKLQYKEVWWKIGPLPEVHQETLCKNQVPLNVDIPNKKKRIGGPKKVSKRDLRFLQTSNESTPRCSNLSDRFIQKKLKEDMKMPSRRAAKTPMLTEKMKSERFKFESTHKHWTDDESSFGTIRSTVGSVCSTPRGLKGVIHSSQWKLSSILTAFCFGDASVLWQAVVAFIFSLRTSPWTSMFTTMSSRIMCSPSWRFTGDQFPQRWCNLPQGKEGHGLSERAVLWGDQVARELPGPLPDQACLQRHHGKAYEKEYYLRSPAEGRDTQDPSVRHPHLYWGVHAWKDPKGHWPKGGHGQILKTFFFVNKVLHM